MNFTDVKSVTIPEGNVVKISKGSEVLWQKVVAVNRWNFKDRTEFIGDPPDGQSTYYFDPTGAYSSNKIMPVSEDIFYNGGRRLNYNGVYYSTVGGTTCTISNVTEDGLTFKSGGATEMFIAVPFHLNAGEKFDISYYSSGTNRSGYHIFNTDGSYRSYTLNNQSGAGNKTFTYTATDECWIAWQIGKYDANSSVTLSNIVLYIS